jgi:AraC family transcriptional activator of pyochelin receptor
MTRPVTQPRRAPGRAYSLSIAEMHSAAARGVLATPRLVHGEPAASELAVDREIAADGMLPCGMQEVVGLSDDLMLVRTDVDTTRLSSDRDAAWEIDTRGWLYLHFRLEGISVDRLPEGPEQTVGGGSFLVCASSRPSAFARQVLSEAWRVVTVAFRPSDAFHNLPVAGANLPTELRRFRAGDPDVDFFYASPFTPDMRAAASALLKPVVRGELRPFYLRAKAVELVCLAVEQVGRPAPQTDPPLKLSHRDVLALEEAKRLVDQANESHSLDQLARRVGLNRRKLALGFKLLFGTPVGEYHRQVRLECARRLLEARTASVSYAATVAGYSDVGSFGKAFKARYGWLPSQARAPAGGGSRSWMSNASPNSE